MKVPSLEDMIQDEMAIEIYICETCHRPLREHHLIEDIYHPAGGFICCHAPDLNNTRFRYKKGTSINGLANAIYTMQREKRDESPQS